MDGGAGRAGHLARQGRGGAGERGEGGTAAEGVELACCRRGRTKAEVDAIIEWLTGYGPEALAAELDARTDFETFFAKAPRMNPARKAVTGVVCGVRVETVEDPLMREIRYLDKLVDELARGKRMEKIVRAG